MILAINTQSEHNSIALYYPGVLEKEVSWVSYKTQSKELLPKISKLLEKNNIKLAKLKAIAVFRGPGSYTGLRVGIAVANALAWGFSIPVIGIGKKSQAKSSFQNFNNLKISALEIAKKAYKILNKKGSDKFVLVEPVYVNPIS